MIVNVIISELCTSILEISGINSNVPKGGKVNDYGKLKKKIIRDKKILLN